MLENVDMKKEYLRIISEYVGLFPVNINSNLLSAQNRSRNYWTNIRVKKVGLFEELYTDIPLPKDEGILLRDILDKEVDEKYYINTESMMKFVTDKWRLDKKYTQINGEKGLTQQARQYSSWRGDYVCVAMRGRNVENPGDRTKGIELEQRLEPNTTGKTNCLSTVSKDNLIMQINPSLESGGRQPYQQNRIYDTNGITPALCANKSDLLIRQKARGFNKGNDFKDKTPTLSSNSWEQNNILHDNYRIRRLTPNECRKLQNIPDWYKWDCSDSQIYRMLGNGWENETIKHILSFMKLN